MLTDSPGDRGLCLSPLRTQSMEQNVGIGWGLGKGHSTLALQQSQIASPLATDLLSSYMLSSEEQPKLFYSLLINPGLSASGKVTLFIKMPLWAPKKKKKSCSTMVICIQREKKKSGVHCPVTKKLEALTPPAIDRFLNRHIFCITTPASNTPSGRKKSFFSTAQVLLARTL